MGRTIGSVVAGYLAMFVIIFATFSAAYIGMGADRAFQAGSYAPSGLWLAVSWALGFVAALVGGWVCAAIGRTRRAVNALAIVTLALGVLFAIPVMTQQTDPGPRPGTVTNMEAMQKAQTPLWVALINPLVGAAGVVLAGRRKIGTGGTGAAGAAA